MRRLCILLCLCLLWMTPALAELLQETPAVEEQQLQVGTGDLRWPVLTGLSDEEKQQRINNGIMDVCGVRTLITRQAQVMSSVVPLRSDWEGGVTGNVLSLKLRASGPVKNLRATQTLSCFNWDLKRDCALTWADLFTDPEEAAEWLEAYITDQVQPTLSGYTEAALLPLPETWWVDACGLTLCYPIEDYETLSEHAGTVKILWYELADLLLRDSDGVPARMGILPRETDGAAVRGAVSEGVIPGLPLNLGEDIQPLIDTWGLRTDPDLCEGSRMLTLDDDRFRGVWVLTDDLGTDLRYSQVTGIRADRFSIGGLIPGVTTREECCRLLGEPDHSVTLEGEQAERWRLEDGTDDYYALDRVTLRLHYDRQGILTSLFLMAN